ncbi:hypothetical protein AYI69_g2830 [Smittium culicis]|uniref:LYC1 C-terminal domain-containing protein n=1 Tax=Smittium culicis TaxID=133412 RepID=A0A1R1YLJ2_9FUNG|nr:hypothetical protein AYI69_g2830 [Smittium culicis]
MAQEMVLVEALTKEQKEKTFSNTYKNWGASLMEQEIYMDRERLAAVQDLTKEKLTHWLYGPKLAFEKNPKMLDFYASIETIARKMFIKRCGSSKVQEIDVFSITKVFCCEEYRSKGHATRMLKDLYEILKNKGEASDLYSDIGRGFYSKLGYDEIDNSYVTINSDSLLAETHLKASLINRNLLREITKLDSDKIYNELEAEPISNTTRICITPTYEIVEWRNVRDEFEGMNVFNSKERLELFGAVISDQVNSDVSLSTDYRALPSFITWTCRFREKGLFILRTRFNLNEDIVPLINSALEYAKKKDLSHILFWNPKAEVLAELQANYNAKIAEQSNSIPCIALFNKLPGEKIEWLNCENYAWI